MSPRGGGGGSSSGVEDGESRVAMSCPTAAAATGNGTFQCLTGGQCVNATDVCNGVDDCADASDESFTHAHCYGTQHPPYLSLSDPYSTPFALIFLVAAVVHSRR